MQIPHIPPAPKKKICQNNYRPLERRLDSYEVIIRHPNTTSYNSLPTMSSQLIEYTCPRTLDERSHDSCHQKRVI